MAAHNENLRFDRRLTHRRGWVSDKELARHLRSLPDVEEQGEWLDPVAAESGAAEEAAESAPVAAESGAAGEAAAAAADAPQAR
ncbi:MAG: hypothetical protein OXU53_06020 [Deltaproteobacteria bacterium]|nr:hypothetical protein [Deltaproteobacteria bacterium]